MEKKRSAGVIAIGAINTLLGLLFLSHAIWVMSSWMFPKRDHICGLVLPVCFLYIILGLPLLITGLRILKLKPKVPGENILLAVLLEFPVGGLFLVMWLRLKGDMVFLYIGIPFILWALITCVFFTRPKVKEQFKKEEIPNA